MTLTRKMFAERKRKRTPKILALRQCLLHLIKKLVFIVPRRVFARFCDTNENRTSRRKSDNLQRHLKYILFKCIGF